MADEKQSFGSRGTRRHGSGIFPDADYLFSRARTLFRAARAAQDPDDRERLERAAYELEQHAQQMEQGDRYGHARSGNTPGSPSADPPDHLSGKAEFADSEK